MPLVFLLFVKLKSYSFVDSKGTMEVIQLTFCTKERRANLIGAEKMNGILCMSYAVIQ